ncbi:MAG: alkaline phosphatase family protein [Actinobacteria bacterium]|nr:alkaline phosphatase family protein [Actinomycetota bacterium]
MGGILVKRVLIIAIVAAVIAAGAAYLLRPETGVPEAAPTEREMAASIGTDVMRHLHRGHVPGRSGEIMLVPKPHHFIIGDWDLTTLGSDTPTLSTSHPNPWAYLARVPIILYGDTVPRGRTIEESVDITQLAPTYARMVGFALDGTSAPLPGFDQLDPTPPKAIVTVVIDGGGWNALQEHPDSWPNMARLMREGTTFTNATIGSAPSVTGALHANFGTGTYPVTHRIPGNQMRGPDGKNHDTWQRNADPSFLEAPTLADLWDVANGNEAVIATVSYEGWHLGMIGHGAAFPKGDKDIAVLWELDEDAWWINENFYSLPAYLQETDISQLEAYEEQLDRRDHVEDGTWFGHTIEEIQEVNNQGKAVVRPGVPSFVRFTGDAVVEILRREPFGADGITDFYWIEMKMPDYAGHAWNVTNPEQADVIAETDAQIGRLVSELDNKLGEGRYVFAVSADHGQQPLPDLLGGWRINSNEIERDVESRFGTIVEKVTPSDIYFDVDVMEREGVRLADVARWLGTYTIGENIRDGAPGAENVPDARRDDKIFAGVFSTEFLANLSDQQIDSFGRGDYPQGDLTSPPQETGGIQAIP